MDKAGLYIHIPFCTQKCNYCDFYSIKAQSPIIETFINALRKEISFYSEHSVFSRLKFSSIFFGGGTPSLLSSNQINRIIEQLNSVFSFESEIEFTIEANPESLSLSKLKQYNAGGINRLSIGVQSFWDKDLKRLGRSHNSQLAKDTVQLARDAGFNNISIDLIFGILDQSQIQWEANLFRAVEMDLQHISAYGLTVAPGTLLEQKIRNGEEKRLAEDSERQMYLSTINILFEHGYSQYEISNFAKRGFECQHNEMYWDLSPYLGFGPSAHSFWKNHRQWNFGNLNKYLDSIKDKKKPIAEFEYLTPEQKQLEFIFLCLRRSSGIDVQKYNSLFQISFWDRYKNAFKKLENYPGPELFIFDNNQVRLTAEGFVLYNEVCKFFI